mgnify:CR=1 FL=1
MALILANEMGSQIRITSGPVIEKASDLAGLLTNLEEGDILFIDEIHRIPRTVEEYLYSAMEDYRIDIMIDQGPNARSVRLTIPKFTLIGATTRTGLLTAPLRSRFTLKTRLDYYSKEELKKIVKRTCSLLNIEVDEDGAMEIARRSRGTPRIVNNLVRFVRDYSEERAKGVITKHSASKALELLEIDENGYISRHLMRCEHSKLTTVRALQSMGYDTIASGDSYNDLEMILHSKAGFLFRTTEKIKHDYPHLPAFEGYDELLAAIEQVIRA